MKLLICDDKKIKHYQLPKKIENFFMINFDFFVDKLYFNETLTLKSKDNKWLIIADDKLKVKNNGIECSSIILEDNLHFELKFADMSSYFNVYIVPDFINYTKYSLINSEKINIGSSNDCQLLCSSFINLEISIFKDGYDFNIERVNQKLSSSYLNSLSYNKKKLNIGDTIFLGGVFIVYMKEFLLINSDIRKIDIKELEKIPDLSNNIETPVTPVNDIEKNVKLYNEGQVFVHTPRLKHEIVEEEIEFEAPPAKESYQKIPAIFTVGSSAIMSVTSITSLLTSFRNFASGEGDLFSFSLEIVVFGSMLISSLLLPILMNKWEIHSQKKREKVRQKKYKKYVDDRVELVKSCVKKQENILKENNLSLEKIVENILNNSKDVWNREIFDNDFLNIVLGIGNLPAKISINAPIKQFALEEDDLKNYVIENANSQTELKDVPITFSILNNIIAPIVIDSEYAYDYIKSIMLQLIYYYSGNDLKIVTITNEYNESQWEFIKYVPHSWNKNYDYRFFVSNEDELMQMSLFLEHEYDNRIKSINKNNGESSKRYRDFSEYYLIVTDDYKLARDLSIINKILNSEENLGFSILIFENSIKNLPSKFNTFVQIINDGGFIVERNSTNQDSISFKPLFLPNLEIYKYSRVISNIPLNIKNSKSDIPESLNFLEMFYAGRVDQLNILSRWANNNPVISLKAPIGMKENNKLVELDLHEKFHGPHGLIAGSTGSGKSEFIITFILSMAINYHPYEVQFVLIDYKGGGLAGAFENRETGVKIPHLVGTITNLDVSEMNRTLVSIKSELQRRQRVFNEAREKNDESTIDIYKYQRLYREGKVKEPMSHLFIISDEFAELKAQQPDFMDELVSAARIGRSLGVHLILATQKPSGVVDDQIWSNTRFRVCLKVQTTEDSNELLKRNDAAYIKEAGRFYLQVGNDEIFELGQSGWAGAKYVPSDNIQKKVDDNISFVSHNGEILKSVNEYVKKDYVDDFGDQLTNIVKYLYNLSIRENIKFSSLWLENISENLLYDNIVKKYKILAKPFFINPIIGEYDDPSNQKQGYVDLPLLSSGNTFVIGASGSGKTNLLSTIIYSSIINHNSDEVNFYIVDLGSEKLKIFQNAPQVGEFLTINDSEKIKFLFYMLKEEKRKRFSYYSANGGEFSKDVEKGSCPFPTIVVIINQFDVFKENFDSLYDDELNSFTRNCAQVGIVFIVTSTLTGSLGYMIENNFPKKIMLNMVDPSEYTTYFSKAPIPKKNAGRGIIELDNVYEFQVPSIFEEESYDRNLNYVISKLNKLLDKRASKVPVVPDEIDIDNLRDKITNLSAVPLGVNIRTAQVSTFNLKRTLNIFSSNSNITAKNFFPKFFEILSLINNTKIIVINSIKDLSFNVDNMNYIKYYDSSFKTVIKTINSNVEKYKLENSDNNFVILFLGYAKLQDSLLKNKELENDIVTIDELIYNSKKVENFNYIIYDKDSSIEKLEDGKIDSLFKKDNGIWFGKGFDSQDLFDVQNMYEDINPNNNNIVLIKNGKKDIVKFM